MSEIIDVHVHLAALPDGQNGCIISPKMLASPLFRFLIYRLGLPAHDPAAANRLYIEKLKTRLSESRFVQKAVLLALDGVYGADGLLDRARTDFLISNDYVLAAARENPGQFLPGISVNPKRRDAIAELERCAALGAALVKVLPNTQDFNPAEAAYRAFYKAMARLKLPLLSHVGYEFSLWGKDQSVGDPTRLETALEEGVTVIAAHGASHGVFFYEKHWRTLNEYVRRYPHFFWDASALSLPNRVGMLLRLRRRPALIARMVFGTDYPLPVYAYPGLLIKDPGAYAELRRLDNPFDRQFRMLALAGMPPQPTPWLERK